jgi:hypothetical protein
MPCGKKICTPLGNGCRIGIERGWANGKEEKMAVFGCNFGFGCDSEYHSMEEPGFL